MVAASGSSGSAHSATGMAYCLLSWTQAGGVTRPSPQHSMRAANAKAADGRASPTPQDKHPKRTTPPTLPTRPPDNPKPATHHHPRSLTSIRTHTPRPAPRPPHSPFAGAALETRNGPVPAGEPFATHAAVRAASMSSSSGGPLNANANTHICAQSANGSTLGRNLRAHCTRAQSLTRAPRLPIAPLRTPPSQHECFWSQFPRRRFGCPAAIASSSSLGAAAGARRRCSKYVESVAAPKPYAFPFLVLGCARTGAPRGRARCWRNVARGTNQYRNVRAREMRLRWRSAILSLLCADEETLEASTIGIAACATNVSRVERCHFTGEVRHEGVVPCIGGSQGRHRLLGERWFWREIVSEHRSANAQRPSLTCSTSGAPCWAGGGGEGGGRRRSKISALSVNRLPGSMITFRGQYTSHSQTPSDHAHQTNELQARRARPRGTAKLATRGKQARLQVDVAPCRAAVVRIRHGQNLRRAQAEATAQASRNISGPIYTRAGCANEGAQTKARRAPNNVQQTYGAGLPDLPHHISRNPAPNAFGRTEVELLLSCDELQCPIARRAERERKGNGSRYVGKARRRNNARCERATTRRQRNRGAGAQAHNHSLSHSLAHSLTHPPTHASIQ